MIELLYWVNLTDLINKFKWFLKFSMTLLYAMKVSKMSWLIRDTNEINENVINCSSSEWECCCTTNNNRICAIIVDLNCNTRVVGIKWISIGHSTRVWFVIIDQECKWRINCITVVQTVAKCDIEETWVIFFNEKEYILANWEWCSSGWLVFTKCLQKNNYKFEF